MTLKQLTEILGIANIKTIHKELLALGYIYCHKDKMLRKLNVVDLFNGDELQSEDIIDKTHKFVYDGCITHNVIGYEQYEFITITVCKIQPAKDVFEDEEAVQHEVRFYAKVIESERL